MIVNNPQPVETDTKPIVKKNPLFDEPQIAEDETFTGEQVQVASLLGKAFIQPLKKAMDEVPQVVVKAKELDMGEEAMARSEEFLKKHDLPATELPDKVENINLKYLEAPEQVNRTIDEIATMMPEKVEEARGGVQSWEQTQKLAGELGMTVDDLLARKQGDAWNAQSIYAARTMLATARDTVDGLAVKINSEGGATPEEMIEFRQMLGVYAGIQQQMHGLAAEAGRALNQFRIVAKSGDLKKQEINNLLDRAGPGATERMAKMWGAMDDPAQKAKFAKKAHSATGMDMVLEYWINSLLSAPSTHAVNIMGNSLTAMWSLPEKAAARGISMLLRDDAIAPSETTAMAYGLYKGSMDGLKLAWQVLKSGEPEDPLQKIEMSKYRAITGENVQNLVNRGVKTGGKAANWMLRKDTISPDDIELSGWVGRGVDALGSVIRSPGLALMAEDEFFKSIAYRMELNSLAAREAFKEGLTGSDAAVRISAILDSPPETMHVSAMDASHYKTFTNKLGAEAKLQQWMVERPVLRFIMPFVRTPLNITAYSFERIPGLNMLVKRSREELFSGDPARRDIAMGKLAMGSMFMTAAMPFVSEHFDNTESDFEITGAAPAGALRSQWRRNHQPYSIRVGDEWVAYNRLDPLGQMLGIMADSVRIMRNSDQDTLEEYSVAIVHAISNNLINKTYMSGVADFFEVFTSFDEQKWAKFTKRFGASFMPNVARRLETQIDPTVRLTDDIISEFCARTVGCSDKLPPMRNLWGDPIETRSLGPNFVSPIFNMKQNYSTIDKELDRLKFPIRMPSHVVMGAEMTDEQYSDYVELQGKKVVFGKGTQFADISISGLNMKDALGKLVTKSKMYQKGTDSIDPPGLKVKLINQMKDMYRTQSQYHLLQKYPELLDSVQLRKQTELEALGNNPFDAMRMGLEYSNTMRQSVFTNLQSRVVE